MQPIRSAQSATFQKLLSLAKESKTRQSEQLLLVEGPHLCAEAVQQGLAQQVWATAEALADEEESAGIVQAAQAAKVPMGEMTAALLARLCDTRQPQGWVTVVRRPVKKGAELTLWLALDGLQDPGNLGTLIRCAWAAQAGVLIGPGSADAWAPKVVRSGAGAHFAVPIVETTDLAGSLRDLQGRGFKLAAADPRGALAYTAADLKSPTVLLLGAEGPGLSSEILELAQERLKIVYPGGAESLNAAVSGSLLLFEALRQRANT